MSHMHMSRQYRSGTTVSFHSQARKAPRSTNPCLSVRADLRLSARWVLLRGTFTRACSRAVLDLMLAPQLQAVSPVAYAVSSMV